MPIFIFNYFQISERFAKSVEKAADGHMKGECQIVWKKTPTTLVAVILSVRPSSSTFFCHSDKFWVLKQTVCYINVILAMHAVSNVIVHAGLWVWLPDKHAV